MDWVGAALELRKWVHGGGRVLPGLVARRQAEIESSKRDPRLSSIERIADEMELAVMLVPEHMAPDIRRYIASQGRVFGSGALKCATNPLMCAKNPNLMDQHEGLTFELDAERRQAFGMRGSYLMNELSDDLSNAMVKRVHNRYGVEIWPWERAEFTRTR